MRSPPFRIGIIGLNFGRHLIHGLLKSDHSDRRGDVPRARAIGAFVGCFDNLYGTLSSCLPGGLSSLGGPILVMQTHFPRCGLAPVTRIAFGVPDTDLPEAGFSGIKPQRELGHVIAVVHLAAIPQIALIPGEQIGRAGHQNLIRRLFFAALHRRGDPGQAWFARLAPQRARKVLTTEIIDGHIRLLGRDNFRQHQHRRDDQHRMKFHSIICHVVAAIGARRCGQPGWC
jgi:hypothetical protein